MEIIENDFDRWNRKKQVIHNRPDSAIFRERDIWWCSLGYNVGSEVNGKNDNFERPVIIFRIFSQENFWAIPLTSRAVILKSRKECAIMVDGIPRTVDVSQLRLISSKRLLRYFDTVSYTDFQNIRRIFIELG